MTNLLWLFLLHKTDKRIPTTIKEITFITELGHENWRIRVINSQRYIYKVKIERQNDNKTFGVEYHIGMYELRNTIEIGNTIKEIQEDIINYVKVVLTEEHDKKINIKIK